MTRPTCATCCHFDRMRGLYPGDGYCRVRPPQMGTAGRGVWPIINESRWCAEHFEPVKEEGE